MLSMLVTRPEPDASDTAARLRALGVEPVVAPLLRFTLLPTTLPSATGFAALAVTSANALRALHDRGELPRFRHLPVHTVGDSTAQKARELGFDRVESAKGNLDDLVRNVVAAGLEGPILHLAARDQSGDLARAVAPYGNMVISTPVYAMEPATHLDDVILAALNGGAIAAALFYSRRTAETFVSLADSRLGRPAHVKLGVLCLSEAVAAPLVDAHFVRVGLADHPSEEAMMALALSFARDQNPA